MENLSSLSSALQAVLDSPGGGETLASTVERYLTTTLDITTKRAVCETLLEILNDESDGQTSLEQRRTSILADTALTYTPSLLPLVLPIPQANDLLLLLAQYASPKEMVLALVEGVQSIVDRAEGFTVSDDEDEVELGTGGEGDGEVDWADLVLEYEVILRCFISCMTRLTTSRSTPTLLSVDEALSSSLPLISHQTTTNSARKILGLMCQLIDAAWRWVKKTEDAGGEQRAILSNLFFMAVTLLGHKVDAWLTERWFLAAFPKFKGLHTSVQSDEGSSEGWEEGARILDRASALAFALDITLTDLHKRIIDPTSLSIHASLASLNLLSSTFPANPENISTILPSPLPTSFLSDSMPLLCAALSGSSVDAAVTWTWALVHRSSQEREAGQAGLLLEYDNASMLVELLVPLTAQHPSPITRLALFKLIGAIVDLRPSATDKIELLRQLLEPANPFENIRIQSLSLLREQLSSHGTAESIQVPILLEELGPVLFALPSDEDPDDSPFDLEPTELMASFYPTWWTEVLSLLWFISSFWQQRQDQTDDNGQISNGSARIAEWVKLVESKLKEVHQYHLKTDTGDHGDGEGHDLSHEHDAVGGVGGEAFIVMRWEDALQRVRSLDQLPL
ncbi:hypothetical protein IAT40_003192 [Kwoniella sp. CBS 6097]